MALLLSKASQLLRQQGSQKLPQLLKASAENSLGPGTIVAANLTAYPGGEAPRYKPWPYAEKGFGILDMARDRVDWRLDDNSKIIVIDGNLATGKTAIGKHIAKQFDLLYIPDVTDTDMYMWETGNKYDAREYDEQLPLNARSCDFESFYSQTGYKSVLKNFPRTQYFLFRYKLLKYAQLALAHVLSTGQGVVMNRGMWSDMVFAHALKKTGWMSPEALKEYKFQYRNTTDYWWPPHLVIYLDAPVELVRENINKRGTPWEKNSPVITDEFLQAMRDSYKEQYLPQMRKTSEVVTYDLGTEEIDLELLVEELESLDLDNPTEEYPDRFADWTCHNREKNRIRRLISPNNQTKIDRMFDFHPLFSAPELWLHAHDYYQYEDLVQKDPRCMDARYGSTNSFAAAMTIGSDKLKPCSQAPNKPR